MAEGKAWSRFLRWHGPGLCGVLLALVPLDWHVVHARSWDHLVLNIACTLMPDCRPDFSAAGEPPETTSTCTGLAHDGAYLMVLVAGACLALLAKPRWWVQLPFALAIVALVYYGQLLAHLFERVEPLWPENVFLMLSAILALGALAQLVTAIARLYARRRRAAELAIG